MPSSESSHSHFPGIDGLRALAVVSVIVFHLNPHWLSGGFVGVDVFFAISGFVVTASIGRFRGSFAAFYSYFYSRRLSRIAPALLICLVSTSFVETLFIPSAFITDGINRTGVAAIFGYSNIILDRQTGGYFDIQAGLNPFTHTWSLAVEEQFYFLFPLLFATWPGRSEAKGRGRFTPFALELLTIASLVTAITQTSRAPTDAFYLLPSRFWELGFGVALYLSQPRWQPALTQSRTRFRLILGLVCLFALCFSFVVAQDNQFPFPWAVPPVVATCGLIMLCVASPAESISQLLALKPVRYLGSISYSLYLWHWPIFILMRWTCGLHSGLQFAIAALMTLGMAAASYRYIEQPTRRALHVSRISRFGSISIVMTSVVVATLLVKGIFHFSDRLSQSAMTHDENRTVPSMYPPSAPDLHCAVAMAQSDFFGGLRRDFHPSDCENPRDKVLFVLGDSHAGAYTDMVRDYSGVTGSEVVLLTMGGCGFSLGTPVLTPTTSACAEFMRSALASIRKQAKPGDASFLAALRVPRFSGQDGPIAASADPDPANVSAAIDELEEQMQPLSNSGITIVLDAPKRVFRAPAFRCIDWFNRHNPVCEGGLTISRAELKPARIRVTSVLERVAATIPGARIWDPFPILCPEDECSVLRNGAPMFFDGDHLSKYGNSVLVPSFAHFMGSLSEPNST